LFISIKLSFFVLSYAQLVIIIIIIINRFVERHKVVTPEALGAGSVLVSGE